MKKIGDRVKLNGKRNKHHNGLMATIKDIFIRRDGKVVVRVNEIDGLHPNTEKPYFHDQVK